MSYTVHVSHEHRRGEEAFLESESPRIDAAVVFEDDGETA